MNTEEPEKVINEKINPLAEQLADLPVSDEQANQAKGGPLNYVKIEYDYRPQKESGT